MAATVAETAGQINRLATASGGHRRRRDAPLLQRARTADTTSHLLPVPDGLVVLDILYFAMVGAFFTHELDAVQRHEWRVLPLLRSLPERIGAHAFIWLHIPLLALLLWGGDGTAVNATRIGLSAFAVIHVGLHVAFRHHPAYEFNNPGSWALIVLTGVLGAAYLAAVVTGWPA